LSLFKTTADENYTCPITRTSAFGCMTSGYSSGYSLCIFLVVI